MAAIAAAVLDRPDAATWCERAFEISSEHHLKGVYPRLFAATAATLRRLGHPREADALHGYFDALATARRNIDLDDRPTRGVDYDRGAAMSRDEAITFALAALRSSGEEGGRS